MSLLKICALGLVIIPKFVNCGCEEMLRRDKGVYQLLVEDNSGEFDITYGLAYLLFKGI